MAWVYPQSVIDNDEWYPYPNSVDILTALQLGDNEYAWTPAGVIVNILHLDMGQPCGECHIRARRGQGFIDDAQLVVTFSDGTDTEQWIVNLTNVPDWTDFYYTPTFAWDTVLVEGESATVPVGVSVLRGQSAEQPTRRTLTGVGI